MKKSENFEKENFKLEKKAMKVLKNIAKPVEKRLENSFRKNWKMS